MSIYRMYYNHLSEKMQRGIRISSKEVTRES